MNINAMAGTQEPDFDKDPWTILVSIFFFSHRVAGSDKVDKRPREPKLLGIGVETLEYIQSRHPLGLHFFCVNLKLTRLGASRANTYGLIWS